MIWVRVSGQSDGLWAEVRHQYILSEIVYDAEVVDNLLWVGTGDGVAISDNITKAYEKAFQTDPESSFGGVIALNRKDSFISFLLIISSPF